MEGDNLYIVMEFAEHGDIYRQVRCAFAGLPGEVIAVVTQGGCVHVCELSLFLSPHVRAD